MRFLHTADWHLGRLFHGISLTEEQAPLLDQIFQLASEQRVDALLLSGDLYDRSVPPADAVRLFDDFLNRMAGANIPVIAIAGNHDSGDRLSFGARLMQGRGIHLAGRLTSPEETLRHAVRFEDEVGPILVYSLPYAEPPLVREVLACSELREHQRCMQALLAPIRAHHPEKCRSILLAHAFVGGGSDEVQESESERPLSIGGTGFIDASVFTGFDYVALGHLHRPQRAGSDRVHYAGSLLPYAFSELDHQKSIHLVEMDAMGMCRIEKISLEPRHALRILEGELEDLLRDAAADRGTHSADDYLLVRLLDKGALLHPMAQLREFYPNVLQLERPALEEELGANGSTASQRVRKSTEELFDDFFSQVTGNHLDAEEKQAYSEVVEAMYRREREAATSEEPAS